jgi:hypothetical protein
MLGTIKLPHNMNLIQKNLPGSNYDSDKPKRDKRRSMVDNLEKIKEETDEQLNAYPSHD